MNDPTPDPVLGHHVSNTWAATVLVAAGLLLLSILTGRGSDGADHSQEAIDAVSKLLDETTIQSDNNLIYVAFTLAAGESPPAQRNGFVEPLRPRAAAPAIQNGIMEITTYGRFDPVALKSGPGSDWNEQVSLRVRSFRVQTARGWSKPTILGLNTMQWTVGASGGSIQVFVRPEVGPMGIPDEGVRELVASIFNVPAESVTVSKPVPSR